MLCMSFNACIHTVIKAELVSNDSVDKEYVFPNEVDNLTAYSGGSTQLVVPVGLLQNISKNVVL